MKKKISISLILGIIVALIVDELFPSILMGCLFCLITFPVLVLFDNDKVEILEEYKRGDDAEDPEEILP